MRDIQLAENYILQKLKDICDLNGISFFLLYGTLLGAVRHHGFIPWDDDLDIGMSTDDYVKLEYLLSSHPELELKKYCLPYSHGILSKVKFKSFESPYIDIFVFEKLDCNSENVNECWEETSKLNVEYIENMNNIIENKFSYIDTGIMPVFDSQLDITANALFEKLTDKCMWFTGKGAYFARPINTVIEGRKEKV